MALNYATYDVGKGFIWSVSANAGRLAVVEPPNGGAVHLIDTETWEKESITLTGLDIDSVAITPDGYFIYAKGVRGGGSARAPEVAIGPIIRGYGVTPYPVDWTGQLPNYDERLLFGKIAIMPGENRALIAGVSDRHDTRGFVLHVEWDPDKHSGSTSVLIQEIDEAPEDIVVVPGRAFVATGRGGQILVYDTYSNRQEESLVVPRSRGPEQGAFKPTRLAVTSSLLVAASYNGIYSWYAESPGDHREIVGSNYCINGLAFISSRELVCALTYSNVLMSLPFQEGSAQIGRPDIWATRRDTPIQRPCLLLADPRIPDRLYVVGHSNGQILVVSRAPLSFGSTALQR